MKNTASLELLRGKFFPKETPRVMTVGEFFDVLTSDRAIIESQKLSDEVREENWDVITKLHARDRDEIWCNLETGQIFD